MPATPSPLNDDTLKLPQWSIDAFEGRVCEQCAHKDKIIDALCKMLQGSICVGGACPEPFADPDKRKCADCWREWAEGEANK
jgi:hypothetical protein